MHIYIRPRCIALTLLTTPIFERDNGGAVFSENEGKFAGDVCIAVIGERSKTQSLIKSEERQYRSVTDSAFVVRNELNMSQMIASL